MRSARWCYTKVGKGWWRWYKICVWGQGWRLARLQRKAKLKARNNRTHSSSPSKAIDIYDSGLLQNHHEEAYQRHVWTQNACSSTKLDFELHQFTARCSCAGSFPCLILSWSAISYMDKHSLDMVRPAQRYFSMSKLIADESILQLHRVAADLWFGWLNGNIQEWLKDISMQTWPQQASCTCTVTYRWLNCPALG